MRILLLGINFHPELTGIGKYTGELTCFLSGANHEVRVVTAPPYYPYWKVESDYKWWQYRRDEWQGIRIYRTPLWVPHNPSGTKRLIHLLSFAISSFPILLTQIQWKPDVVLCIAPAFAAAPFAWLTARMSKAKAWLHIQDFELDAAVNLGLLPENHFLTKWAASLERWILARFDRISTISNRMMQKLTKKGVDSKRLVLFPNWVDTNSIYPLPDSHASLCRNFGIPEDKFVILYSGNMGLKQGLEIVLDIAEQLQENPNILFVLCGEGAARRSLESAAVALPNVQFLQLQPIEALNQLLNIADVHLLPQQAGAADLVMPSKLLGMLASGKIVVATATPGTELGDVIDTVGVLIPPGDAGALSAAISRLSHSAEECAYYGQLGRKYVCEHWSAELILPAFQSELMKLQNT